jgi:Protein of unknown function (DUF2975)
MQESRREDIPKSSARLRRIVTVLLVALWVLLLLERFGRVAMTIVTTGMDQQLLRRIGYEVVSACPEVLYLMSLWWIRQALATFARGDFYAPTVARMLNRVGVTLATGAFLNVFVVPGLDRVLGFGPGYWVAFDVAGLVLGAIGLSLAIVARVLDRARELKAELDEIF